MKRMGLSAFFVVLLPALAEPAVAPESIRALGTASFAAAGAFQPPKAPTRRFVHLSDFVTLRGSAWVREGDRHVSVEVTGTARFTGDGGRVQSGTVYIRERVSVWMSGGSRHVSETVRPSAYVSLYRDGRYVGSGYVSGSIRVSGWVSGTRLTLDGTGTMSGSVQIEIDE